MKRILLIFVIAFVFISCGNLEHNNLEQDSFLNKNIISFSEKYSNWNNNNLTRDSVNAIFSDSVNVWFENDEILNQIPVTIISIDKAKDDDGKIISIGIAKSSYRINDMRLNLGLSMILNDSIANSLIESKNYFIKGHVIKNISKPKGIVVDEYDLGSFRLKVDSIWDKH